MSVSPYSTESMHCTTCPVVFISASSVARRSTPRPPFPKLNAFLFAHVSPRSVSSSQLESVTRSFTSDPNSPGGFEKMRAVDASMSSPAARSSSACFLMKFISTGSSASAARFSTSSSSSITLANESRKIPDSDASTSTRGRPSFSSGISSKRTTRPVASTTGCAPIRPRTTATDSPLVLIASSPHRFTATVSGSSPALSR
mmetsp:Transcript_36304/g.85358  ORF Transcript_36304/g.85358 Transcript_36304/m.85358 type:complete len:201 (+) Transcript_36304:688-1290(+)